MPETFHIVPEAQHNALIAAAYRHRGYLADEAEEGARFCAEASRHGIRTHNGLKALHLDHVLGSGSQGCVPGAQIEEKPTRFAAAKIWNANKKLGQSTAYRAMAEATRLADQYGVGTVSVDNAFHYLWGGGYVMEAAKKGYIAYTNCTAAKAEVVPFGGKFPTLGTNPHSWGFPTTEAVGFPIVIDWATSVIAMGRVQQLKREGKPLPPLAAVDKAGRPTTDPDAVAALLPFGAHKGYGLSLIDELVAGFIGGSLPTLRNDWPAAQAAGEKATCTFFFQVIHPEAISGGAFAKGRTQAQNIQAVLADVLGHGNEACLLPGQLEAEWAKKCAAAGGLLFSTAEVEAFNEVAAECHAPRWDAAQFKSVTI
jgi:LDH2 family malate/lactate/ureidoglycolate dehydrogenase